MKVFAVNGSARKDGNTETIIREILRGAGEAEAEIVMLSDLDFGGCLGCRACREEGADGCVVDDAVQGLYEKMKEADVLVLGSPVFYGEVTGQMKCFMDRWYALRDADRALRIAPGKKAVFAVAQGAEEGGRYKCMTDRIEKVLKSYEMLPQVMVFPGLEEKGEVKVRPELMRKALDAGVSLCPGR